MSMTLKITIMMKVNNKGFEQASNTFDTYLFQYLVCANNSETIINMARKIVIISPPIFIVSKG
jgi:flagellar biosynthesis regulator FlbT